MYKKSTISLLLLICLFVSGCGSSKVLLRRNQKSLNLKPNEGGVIFSLYSKGTKSFSPQNVTIQEINQYKHFKKRKLDLIPRIINKTDRDVYLFGLKLPRGTYRLSHFGGLVSGIFQFFVPCNKIIDVSQGEITYAGRVEIDTSSKVPSVAIDDLYNADCSMFLDTYSVLQDKDIRKDLMY